MEFMQQNIGESVSKTKHNGLGAVLPQHNQFEDRWLNGAFVEMAGALPKYPEPSHLFRNVASKDRLPHKGKMAVVCGKLVMRAAIATGVIATMESSARRVAHYFDSCKAAALADYSAIAKGEISFDDAVVRASKETTEALHAILAGAVRDESGDLTVREIDEAIVALGELRSKLVAAPAQPVHRRALALS